MRFLPSLVFTLCIVLAIMVVVPFTVVAVGFWAAEGSWNFEGRGIKYWMFVQGSRLERLGTVEPVGTVKYSIRLQEGTFPGWNIAVYESQALPEKVISVYGGRCTKMNLKIIESKTERKSDTGAVRAEMTCQIEVHLDVEIVAERDASADTSKVFIKVWGSH